MSLFEDEVTPVHAPGEDTDIDHAPNVNDNNILMLNHAATADNIAELCVQGIEANNTDPSLKNTFAVPLWDMGRAWDLPSQRRPKCY